MTVCPSCGNDHDNWGSHCVRCTRALVDVVIDETLDDNETEEACPR